MSTTYLIDSCVLIDCFDSSKEQTEKVEASKAILKPLLSEPDSKFAITPLIRYEVLRGIDWREQERFLSLQKALNGFQLLEITHEIADLALQLYRYDQHTSHAEKNVDKRKFDVFHYATAQHYRLK